MSGLLMEERLSITFEGAGAMLGVSARTIRRLVDAGELGLVKIRGARRIDVDSLRTYKAAHTGAGCRTAERDRPSGGSATQRQAAKELENLLAPRAARKPRHLRLVSASKPTE